MFMPYVAYSFNNPRLVVWLETGIGFGHDVPSGVGLPLTAANVIVNEKLHLYAKPVVHLTMGSGLRIRGWYKISRIDYANISDTEPALAYLAYQPIPRTIDGTTPVLWLVKQELGLSLYWEF